MGQGDTVGIPFGLVQVQPEGGAFPQFDRTALERADAQFGSLQVHHHGDRAGAAALQLADRVQAGLMLRMGAMAEV